MQFAPIEGLTLTADYTYALNELTEDRGEQTIWLQRNGFNHLEFDTGEAVATPMLLREFTGASKDFGFEQQHREHRNDLNSIGFNASWDVAENFNLGFDFHNSRAGSHPDDGVTGGSQTSFSLAGKVPSTGDCATRCSRRHCTNFWTQTFPFNDGLPIAARTLFPTSIAAYAGTGGNNDYSFDTIEPWFADPAHQLSGTEHRHQADAHRRQVHVRKRQHVRLRRRNTRDERAPAEFELQPDDG